MPVYPLWRPSPPAMPGSICTKHCIICKNVSYISIRILSSTFNDQATHRFIHLVAFTWAILRMSWPETTLLWNFGSDGPKNYGYQTKQGKMVCKVWGFSLNVQGSAKLYYHILRANTLHELHDPLHRPRITCV